MDSSKAWEKTRTLAIKRDETWPRGYKKFFMLNSTEYEIVNAHKKFSFCRLK